MSASRREAIQIRFAGTDWPVGDREPEESPLEAGTPARVGAVASSTDKRSGGIG